MANKLLFSLLFYTLPFTLTSVFAFNEFKHAENLTFQDDGCMAPPPDSFRIKNAGANFISLTWVPAWVGADHKLSIFKFNSTGGWDSLYSISSGPATYYKFSNLDYNTKYRFKIATKCTGTVEPSELKSIIDGITLILDLVLDGRAPVNPVPLEGCPTINYLNHEWVGFKVERTIGSTSVVNFFEFGVDEGINPHRPVIKRVIYGPNIVASNLGDSYPKNPSPVKISINGVNTFKLIHIQGLHQKTDIGYVDVNFNEPNHSVELCKKPGEFWNENYIFTFLTAKSAIGLITQKSIERLNKPEEFGGISVINPFRNILRIAISQTHLDDSKAIVRLINIHGKIALEQQYDAISEEILVPTEMLPLGFYILHCEIDGYVHTFKIIKAE